jgi:hypothetical protein
MCRGSSYREALNMGPKNVKFSTPAVKAKSMRHKIYGIKSLYAKSINSKSINSMTINSKSVKRIVNRIMRT